MVEVSFSGFTEAASMRSLGLFPMANSRGVLPLRVTWVFLTVAALRINWAGVICDRVVWSRFLEAVLLNRTSISARFGHGVCAVQLEVSSHFAFVGMPACHVHDGKPYLRKSCSDSSGKCPSIHEVWK